MSSHEMSVRASLKVKPTVTLAIIWAAISRFTDRFRIQLEDSATMFDEFGAVPLRDPDDHIELDQQGNLFMNLGCYGGAGMVPEEVDTLCVELDRLVEGGGAIEVIDLETSPSNDDSISVRFVGIDDAQRVYARLNYGFGLAKDWIVDVVGPTDFEDLVKQAHQAAAKRLAPAQPTAIN